MRSCNKCIPKND